MSRCDDVDLDVVVYTNLYADAARETAEAAAEAAAAVAGAGAPGAAGQAPAPAREELRHLREAERLLERLSDPDRQRAVINIDGGPG